MPTPSNAPYKALQRKAAYAKKRLVPTFTRGTHVNRERSARRAAIKVAGGIRQFKRQQRVSA